MRIKTSFDRIDAVYRIALKIKGGVLIGRKYFSTRMLCERKDITIIEAKISDEKNIKEYQDHFKGRRQLAD